MATSRKRALKSIEDAGDNVSDVLFDQIAALRKEIASISETVSNYGGHTLSDVQKNATALAREIQHQGAAVAHQVNRQAHVAGRAIQQNPVPVIVALGTIVLLSALIFKRD
jgi:vacuolar-type H+-ATPase subunit H